MSDSEPVFDADLLEAMNEKAIRNQFFTPDRVYIELGLFKDIPIGAVYAQHVAIDPDEEAFIKAQTHIMSILDSYQVRTYETINEHLSEIGMTDDKLDAILKDPTHHDKIFLLAPSSAFFFTLIQHTIRNQNHSRPAEKFTKKQLNAKQYTLEPIPVTYRINTYPLQLSRGFLANLGPELADSYGVDVEFMCKDPATFDDTDWVSWMKDINCFYIDSLGRFLRSEFVKYKQGEMQFVGYYKFARKRLETSVRSAVELHNDFEMQIQWSTACMSLFCDFEWLQNNQLRLTDEPIVNTCEDDEEPQEVSS